MTGVQTRQLVSRLDTDGNLEVTLRMAEVPAPGPHGLTVRMDAAPINPADVKAMFCGIAPADLQFGNERGVAVVRGKLSRQGLSAHANRIGKDVPLGNEGTGLVVATGDSDGVRAMLGKRVSMAASGTFADLRSVSVDDCIVVPSSASAESAASAWINPMTALAMTETMLREGHRALVLTAAGSSLGKMLNRLCLEDSIPLVNIVRSQEAVCMLRDIGAQYVCNSSDDGFSGQLLDALIGSGATLAFDATGGGALAGKILLTMEQAAVRHAQIAGRYGSTVHKQLYFFGGLDPSPVTFSRSFGMAWGMGGWLLQSVLANFEPSVVAAMKARVRESLNSVFASEYRQVIALEDMLLPDNIADYAQLGTGGKVLIKP